MAAAPGLHAALSHRLSVPEALDEGLAITRGSLRGSCLYATLFLGICALLAAALLRERLLGSYRAATGDVPADLSRLIFVIWGLVGFGAALVSWFWLRQLARDGEIRTQGFRSLAAVVASALVLALDRLVPLGLFAGSWNAGGRLWLPGSWLAEDESWMSHSVVFCSSLILTPVAGLILPIMVVEGRGPLIALFRALRLTLRSRKLVLLGLALWLLSGGLGFALALPFAEDRVGAEPLFPVAVDLGLAQLVLSAFLAPAFATVWFLSYLQIRRRHDGLDVELAARRAGLWSPSS